MLGRLLALDAAFPCKNKRHRGGGGGGGGRGGQRGASPVAAPMPKSVSF